MFDFFGPRKKYTTESSAPLWTTPIIPNTPAETHMSESGYTVGVDNNNHTVLKVTCQGSTITLTMAEPGVRTLIRLLEASLPEYEHEDSSHHDTETTNQSNG